MNKPHIFHLIPAQSPAFLHTLSTSVFPYLGKSLLIILYCSCHLLGRANNTMVTCKSRDGILLRITHQQEEIPLKMGSFEETTAYSDDVFEYVYRLDHFPTHGAVEQKIILSFSPIVNNEMTVESRLKVWRLKDDKLVYWDGPPGPSLKIKLTDNKPMKTIYKISANENMLKRAVGNADMQIYNEGSEDSIVAYVAGHCKTPSKNTIGVAINVSPNLSQCGCLVIHFYFAFPQDDPDLELRKFSRHPLLLDKEKIGGVSWDVKYKFQ